MKLFSNYYNLCDQHHRHRRTDRQTTYRGNTALCVASRGINTFVQLHCTCGIRIRGASVYLLSVIKPCIRWSNSLHAGDHFSCSLPDLMLLIRRRHRTARRAVCCNPSSLCFCLRVNPLLTIHNYTCLQQGPLHRDIMFG